MIPLSPSAVVRSQARQTLKGNYAAAVAAFAVLLLPVFIITGLNYITETFVAMCSDRAIVQNVIQITVFTPLTIIVCALFSPLINGYIRLFYQASLTQKFRMSDLFYYFENQRYAKTLQLDLSYFLRMLLPGVLCFVPLIAYYVITLGFMGDFAGTVLYKDLAFLLTVASVLLLVLYSLKYFLVFTMYTVDDQAEIGDLFRFSKSTMKEQKSAASQLIFSFTPWLLLCLLVLPALYVVPYMTQSLCIGAKWMSMKGK